MVDQVFGTFQWSLAYITQNLSKCIIKNTADFKSVLKCYADIRVHEFNWERRFLNHPFYQQDASDSQQYQINAANSVNHLMSALALSTNVNCTPLVFVYERVKGMSVFKFILCADVV